jgi:two-component system sensor histidine kinase KdpD
MCIQGAFVNDERADQFLSLIQRSQRGRHKVYLGYGPGVGKTTLMLHEGHRLKADHIDIVVGVVETHGRPGTAKLVEGLEVIPRRMTQYHGIEVGEMDLDALLARKPQVALVDELAHTNVPGSRNEKRYQDVKDLIAAGIHVISTMNVQHLESLYDTVERQIGVKVRERIPDAVVADADQVVNVDLAPEDLQRRLEQGDIYPKDRIPSAMENYFKSSNLELLRELTLRELASQIDFRRREVKSNNDLVFPDQIMVCLSSRGPNSARLLRYASRLAGRLNRTWYAVYVQTRDEDPLSIDAVTQRLLSDTLTLANQLGATVFTFKGDDIPQTILAFAHEYRVGHIVIGQPRRLPLWRRLLGKRTVAERLMFMAKGMTIVMADVQTGTLQQQVAVPPPASQDPGDSYQFRLSTLLNTNRIRIWEEPVKRETALRSLVDALHMEFSDVDTEISLAAIAEREGRGSTFLNGGFALPHAHVPGLSGIHVALGLAKQGISDFSTLTPITIIFLILTPSGDARGHVQILASVGRVLRDREVRRRIEGSMTVSDILVHLVDAEKALYLRQ